MKQPLSILTFSAAAMMATGVGMVHAQASPAMEAPVVVMAEESETVTFHIKGKWH